MYKQVLGFSVMVSERIRNVENSVWYRYVVLKCTLYRTVAVYGLLGRRQNDDDVASHTAPPVYPNNSQHTVHSAN